ncbi:hypothetical protein BGZ83_003203, partial [Gryganskiella cystojenkinii]
FKCFKCFKSSSASSDSSDSSASSASSASNAQVFQVIRVIQVLQLIRVLQPVADNETTPVADSETTPVADSETTPIADNEIVSVAKMETMLPLQQDLEDEDDDSMLFTPRWADITSCRKVARRWKGQTLPPAAQNVRSTASKPRKPYTIHTVCNLQAIPSLQSIRKAKANAGPLEDNEHQWLVVDNVGLDDDAFSIVYGMARIRFAVQHTIQFHEWVEADVDVDDSDFAGLPLLSMGRWTLNHKIATFGMNLPISDVFTLAEDVMLTKAMADALLYGLQYVYGMGSTSTILFIPIYATASWAQGYSWDGPAEGDICGELDTEGVQCGIYDKAFTMYRQDGQWYLIKIDFRRKEIGYGCSRPHESSPRHESDPEDAIAGIWIWLKSIMAENERSNWEYIGEICPVGQYSHAGSSGFHLIEAIEFDILKSCHCSIEDVEDGLCSAWNPQPAFDLRVRYLKWIVGYSEEKYERHPCTRTVVDEVEDDITLDATHSRTPTPVDHSAAETTSGDDSVSQCSGSSYTPFASGSGDEEDGLRTNLPSPEASQPPDQLPSPTPLNHPSAPVLSATTINSDAVPQETLAD